MSLGQKVLLNNYGGWLSFQWGFYSFGNNGSNTLFFSEKFDRMSGWSMHPLSAWTSLKYHVALVLREKKDSQLEYLLEIISLIVVKLFLFLVWNVLDSSHQTCVPTSIKVSFSTFLSSWISSFWISLQKSPCSLNRGKRWDALDPLFYHYPAVNYVLKR